MEPKWQSPNKERRKSAQRIGIIAKVLGCTDEYVGVAINDRTSLVSSIGQYA